MWLCFLTFQQRLASFIRYLRITRRLDESLQDATPEEIEHAGSCLICREAMVAGKKLPCAHVFHIDCLRSWLQHQQSCPLCRTDIPEPRPVAPALAQEAPRGNAGHPAPDPRPRAPPQMPNPARPLTPGPSTGLVTSFRNPAADCTAKDLPGFFMVVTESLVLFSSPSSKAHVLTVYAKVRKSEPKFPLCAIFNFQFFLHRTTPCFALPG